MRPSHTKAAVLYELGRPLRIEELRLPPLKANQLLVRLSYSGVCYTQLLEARGKKGVDHFLPHTMGHEGSGVVVECTDDSRFKVGDFIILSWIKNENAEGGGPVYHNETGTKVNAGGIATFSEYAVVSENRCTKIPENLPLHVAALMGCAVPTGAGIVFNQLKPKKGTSIAIFGVGGVGSSSVLAAVFNEMNPIIAIDINSKKLEYAKNLGATHVFHFHECDVHSEIKKLISTGVDFAIEASGNKQAMEFAYSVVRSNGGKVILAGNLKHGDKILIDPFDLILGKEITGTVGGMAKPQIDFPKYSKMFFDGQFGMDKLISEYSSLDAVNETLAKIEGGTILGRSLIQF